MSREEFINKKDFLNIKLIHSLIFLNNVIKG